MRIGLSLLLSLCLINAIAQSDEVSLEGNYANYQRVF